MGKFSEGLKCVRFLKVEGEVALLRDERVRERKRERERERERGAHLRYHLPHSNS
jgi:hypothetical protein